MKHRVFAWFVLVSCTATFALDCNKAITTTEVNECASIEQKKVEARLNEAYQRVTKSLDQPDTDLEKFSQVKSGLIAAQREWVKFRETDCQALYTYYQGGTIRGLMFIGCMQSHAENRIKDLQANAPN
jgi:uncharacterized protein YecT (DUF1311 family)